MHKAADQTGILKKRAAGPTELVFSNEPEAAAMSTLIERGRRPNTGGVYIVCDAGGGTVVSFVIARQKLEQKLKFYTGYNQL